MAAYQRTARPLAGLQRRIVNPSSKARSELRAVLTGLVACLLAGLWPQPAFAHASSNSFLMLHVQDTAASSAGSAAQGADRAQLTGRWDIALRDLDAVLALDADEDGQLRWGEIRRESGAIVDYARRALQLGAAHAEAAVGASASSDECIVRWSPALQIESHTDGRYAVLSFTADCPTPLRSLDVQYRLFAEADAGHRGLLSVESGGVSQAAVAGADAPHLRLDLDRPAMGTALLQYVRVGMSHIFGGYDHLLFLLSLLLPAVLVRTAGQWLGQRSLRSALFDVFRVVTAFTLAHSLTLALAVFGVLRVPTRWSESAIALSVLLAALNNLVPRVHGRRWQVAFAFGLIHGLGFANVLRELALPAGQRAVALLGFNLGVEAGQLCIVLLFLPVAFALRDSRFYRRGFVPAGSGLIAIVATLWLVERLFDQKWGWLP
jgi:hypothetical protein